MKATYDASYRTPAMGRCILLGGVNDIKGGTTGAVAYGYATAILDEMRADGCRPIVLLPTPWAGYSGWSAAAQTEYDTLRTSLSGYCTTNAATTTCIETRTALGNGATPALLAAAYNSGDGIHPNQTGEDVLEGLVFPAFP